MAILVRSQTIEEGMDIFKRGYLFLGVRVSEIIERKKEASKVKLRINCLDEEKRISLCAQNGFIEIAEGVSVAVGLRLPFEKDHIRIAYQADKRVYYFRRVEYEPKR